MAIIRYLTVEDLAERYRVPVTTVESWNRTGTGPEYRRIGREIRYLPADVADWENSRVVGRAS